MKKLFICSIALLPLTACFGPPSDQSAMLQQQIENPLFLERYAEEMVDSMVQMAINEDPILDEANKASVVEQNRTYWLEETKKARREQQEGRGGTFIPIKAYAKGEVLLASDGHLYIGPMFESTPSPSLHVFVSSVIDPRDIEFPDETSIDLGLIHTSYGVQTYKLPEDMENLMVYRTVILWDTDLERLQSFAQIN